MDAHTFPGCIQVIFNISLFELRFRVNIKGKLLITVSSEIIALGDLPLAECYLGHSNWSVIFDSLAILEYFNQIKKQFLILFLRLHCVSGHSIWHIL